MRFDIILDYFKQYGIIACTIIGILLFVTLFVYIFIYKKILNGTKQLNVKIIILAIISFFYAFIVFGAVFLNRRIQSDICVQPLLSSYKLAWYSCSLQGWRNIVLNILLFVPLGILVPLWNKKWNKPFIVLPFGLLTTSLIECFQYIFKIGVFEFDDILNNFLGVVLGYSLLQLALMLCKMIAANTKKLVINIAPLIFLVCTFFCVFVLYQAQPYGNLSASYYQKQTMKGVNVVSNIELSNEVVKTNIYSSKRFSVNDAIELSKKFFDKDNIKVNYDSYSVEDDLFTLNSLDDKCHFTMLLTGGEYNYHNEKYFQINSEIPDTSYSEKQVRKMLSEYFVYPPVNSEFIVNEQSGYEFVYSVNSDNDILYNGTIYCSFFSNAVLGEIDNHMIELEEYSDEKLISEKEVADLISQGKFNSNGIIYRECIIQIDNIDLIYLCDSKNYYQPVYSVDLNFIDKSHEKNTIIIPAVRKNREKGQFYDS